MSAIPNSSIGNQIVHVARKGLPGIGDEVLEAVLALEKAMDEHKASVRPLVWTYVMNCFSMQLRGVKEWPKEPSETSRTKSSPSS